MFEIFLSRQGWW